MALAWNAGWVNALRGSNPLSSATEVPARRFCGPGLRRSALTSPRSFLPVIVREKEAELVNKGLLTPAGVRTRPSESLR